MIGNIFLKTTLGTGMQDIYKNDKSFERKDFTGVSLGRGEYENCVFNSCNLAGSTLSGIRFIDCTFENCNLSLATLDATSFQHTRFIGCKMLGLKFGTCIHFGLSFSFDNCLLDHSSFFKTKIRKTVFRNSQLRETDFAECDLTDSVFDNCDLANTSFDRTILEKADFRTAYNYSIDPEANRIKKAKFSLGGLSGLLSKYNIIIER